ncbi:ATP-dependent DNA helicase [Streptomyces sp. UNOB3_S3]|uniref:ATP-dependent helicase n=1 Tax=Streptomyces sp. UNOB3_S3 TaxID=2871682 RepID=UPI001E4973AC|nr:ATP-dependent DNA helicase [Streptomyces sp. UNOB3_S3]
MKLTTAQLAAIGTTQRDLLIVACAGSGKTEVISRRIVELLKEPGVHPRNIVAFTFTDKAASELKERINARVREELGEVHGLAELFVGTMHGYALDLLHSHAPEAFKFSVLSDVQARVLIDRNSRNSGLTDTLVRVAGKPPRELRRYTESRLYQQVLSLLREDEVDVSQLYDDTREGLTSYRKLLKRHHYFDYSEILRQAADLLDPAGDAGATGPDPVISLRNHVRDTVRYVVVDEYQDTNPVQEQLIRGLTQFGANLCVVGDDDQTIYQWRGSAVANILTFADRYKDVETVTLNDNYRSSRAIVDLGRTIAEGIPSGERLQKSMVASGHQEYERGDLLALTFDSDSDEAEWICNRMQWMRGLPFVDRPGGEARGLDWSDFAVLFRSVSGDAGPLVAELRRRGIPYVIKGLSRLFETPEIKAAQSSFSYVTGEVQREEVVNAWLDSQLGFTPDDIQRGISVLDEARTWTPDMPWDSFTIQGVYLRFLEELGLREEGIAESVGPERGELVFYNLGRFSTAIGDYERIHFLSNPPDRFATFAKWLEYQAADYYEESDADAGYARPNAVTIATVHQSKGMEWPAVFIPCLRKNRFPGKRQGGLNVFHVIPESAVQGAARYRGTEEDERRLFYVAVTRSQKYLAMTFSPSDKKLYKKESLFFAEVTRNTYVLTREPVRPDDSALGRLQPSSRHKTPDVVLSFSELKYLFECPYQFKLRFLYGFDSPLQKELGYGKSLHDVMAEVHKRAVKGDIATGSEVEELVDRHLHAPFAPAPLKEQLRTAATRAVSRYLRDNGARLALTEHSEQPIEVHVTSGVTVKGRIDLIRRLDTGEVSIVDFKSTERAQAEDVTRDQLHIYVVGYEELSGTRADLVEVLNLDEGSGSKREEVSDDLLSHISGKVAAAGNALRINDLPRKSAWCETCSTCDFAAVCRDRPSP